MSGGWVSDAVGTYRPVKGAWVADAVGTYRKVKGLWVADAVGTYRSVSALGANIILRKVAHDPSYATLYFAWTAVDSATQYRLYQVGSGTPNYTGSALEVIINAAPSSSYDFIVRAYNGTTQIAESDPITVRTTGIPSPTRLRLVSVSTTSAAVAWDAVAYTDGYELKNNRTGGLLYNGSLAGTHSFDVDPSTAYSVSVRAKIGSTVSGWTSALAFNSPAPSGPAFGVYYYHATSSATWSPDLNSWRPQSDGLYHGNGRLWGSPRGDQSGWMFYGSRPFTALRGGRVTRFRVFIARLDDAGYNAAQSNEWLLHNYTGRPSGSPVGGIDAGAAVGSLARGDSGWFDLPISWGQALVNGTEAGIAWGNVYNRYMHADDVISSPNNGKLEITIG